MVLFLVVRQLPQPANLPQQISRRGRRVLQVLEQHRSNVLCVRVCVITLNGCIQWKAS